MAEPEQIRPEEAVQVKKLKYLNFVQGATTYVRDRLSTVYEYAKEKSGPVKSGIQTVENTVKTVIGPVYDKFHDVPFDLLYFVDSKVDELITSVDRHVPLLIKEASLTVASEVQRVGVVDAAINIGKKVYAKYEPTAEEYYSKAAQGWTSLSRHPVLGFFFRLMGNLFIFMGNLLRSLGKLFRLLGNLFGRFKSLYKLGFDLTGWRKLVDSLRHVD